jgi:hypothetical protein
MSMRVPRRLIFVAVMRAITLWPRPTTHGFTLAWVGLAIACTVPGSLGMLVAAAKRKHGTLLVQAEAKASQEKV